MLKKIIGKIWGKTPRPARLKIIRLTQKKFTVSVAAVIINEQKEVLLLDHVLRPFSNWGLPGGFIEANEQPESAIIRELYEETGLELKDVKMFRIKTFGRHIEILYTAKSTGIARVKSREINGLGWFQMEQMPENMSPAQKIIIKNALSDKPEN